VAAELALKPRAGRWIFERCQAIFRQLDRNRQHRRSGSIGLPCANLQQPGDQPMRQVATGKPLVLKTGRLDGPRCARIPLQRLQGLAAIEGQAEAARAPYIVACMGAGACQQHSTHPGGSGKADVHRFHVAAEIGPQAAGAAGRDRQRGVRLRQRQAQQVRAGCRSAHRAQRASGMKAQCVVAKTQPFAEPQHGFGAHDVGGQQLLQAQQRLGGGCRRQQRQQRRDHRRAGVAGGQHADVVEIEGVRGAAQDQCFVPGLQWRSRLQRTPRCRHERIAGPHRRLGAAFTRAADGGGNRIEPAAARLLQRTVGQRPAAARVAGVPGRQKTSAQLCVQTAALFSLKALMPSNRSAVRTSMLCIARSSA